MIKLSEKTEEEPMLGEPSRVTVKCNPFPSPERWCWRLSVWKFIQSHSKNSRMPLNSGQLRSVHVERLRDSGESSKETLFCQNASAKYKNHAVWRKEHYYNIPGSTVSSCLWTWLACNLPSKERRRKMRFMAGSQHRNHCSQGRSWSSPKHNPRWSSSIKSFCRIAKHPAVYDRKINCFFTLTHTLTVKRRKK